jgi:hypothetical protein
MTSNEYFVRFFHKWSDDCGLPFSFLFECANQFVRPPGPRVANGDPRRSGATMHSAIVQGESTALKASN